MTSLLQVLKVHKNTRLNNPHYYLHSGKKLEVTAVVTECQIVFGQLRAGGIESELVTGEPPFIPEKMLSFVFYILEQISPDKGQELY